MSEKKSKNENNLLGKKKKKLNLETFLQETESNNKKKKLTESESETIPKDKNKNKKTTKKENSSNKSDSDSDTEVFKITPEIIKPSSSEKQINKFTGKEYTEAYYKLLEKRKSLPVWSSKNKILDLVEKNRIVIIQGETGSGKTTQIPQFLLEAGYYGGIVCTQPRRVAAMSIAKRVSQEMEVELGKQVGYTVRFDDKTSSDTLIKYATDGLLLKEATTDHTLKKYQIIIIDEAHERTVNSDLLICFISQIIKLIY